MLWQQGNEPAFEAIYKKYSPQLLRIAMQKIADRETARELVQDTFIALFKSKSIANNISSVFAYLYTVLKNRILDEYRHNLVLRKYENYTVNSFNEIDNSTQAWIDTRELEKKLNDEIEKLPPQCRTVFKLSRKSYLSNKAIASQLQISENTVEQHMRKALRILRGSLFHYEKILILLALNPTIFNN